MPRTLNPELPAQAGNQLRALSFGAEASGMDARFLPRLGRSSHRGAALFGAVLACVITANAGHKVKNTKTGPITTLRGAR